MIQMNIFMKQKQTHRPNELIHGYQGWRVGEKDG